jgi:YTV
MRQYRLRSIMALIAVIALSLWVGMQIERARSASRSNRPAGYTVTRPVYQTQTGKTYTVSRPVYQTQTGKTYTVSRPVRQVTSGQVRP